MSSLYLSENDEKAKIFYYYIRTTTVSFVPLEPSADTLVLLVAVPVLLIDKPVSLVVS
jgi:hypothetical protein